MREGAQHLRADARDDVAWITCAISDAATVDQAPIGGQAVVVEQVVAVLNAVIAWQQAAGQCFIQRLGGDQLAAAGHRLGSQLGYQVTQVSVSGDDGKACLDQPLCGMDTHCIARLDTHDGGLLMDDAMHRLDGIGLAQGQVEGVNVPAVRIQHATNIDVAGHMLLECLAVEQLQAIVSIACPQGLLGLEMLHLLRVQGCENAAVLEVAVDAVALDPLADDAGPFEGHLAHQGSRIGCCGALDGVDIPAVAVDDLPAIAPRCAKANLGCLQHDDVKALFKQVQGG